MTQGFEKELELVGVGYRAQMQGQKLVLNLGYSNPLNTYPRRSGRYGRWSAKIKVSGADKQASDK